MVPLKEAERLIRILDLDAEEYCRWRRTWIRILGLAQQYELHARLMGYPDNLPDLVHLRPPRGNSRPQGVKNAFVEQRQRGELPNT